MKDNGFPVISVDEIMKKIEEEIAKKRGLPHVGTPRSGVNSVLQGRGVQSKYLLSPEQSERGFVRGVLWKYGTRYAGVIKKVPGLNRIAEYYYWRLSGDSRPVPVTTSIPGPDMLSANLNFAGFLDHLKHEGLKGRIKRRIFTVIGFFAWWQGQVNGALYEKLSEQDARLFEQDARLVEQGARLVEQDARLIEQDARLIEQDGIIGRLAAESAAKDKVVTDLERRLHIQSRLEDAIYEELTAQRAEIARQRGWSASE
jgi:hypothetical protein